MNKPHPELTRVLAEILNELDAQATGQPPMPAAPEGQEGTDAEALNRRLSTRPVFRTPCTVHSVAASGAKSFCGAGVTRNLSAGGIGVVIEPEVLIGQLVEVRISLPDRKEYCIGGNVVFCRPTGKRFHEIGVCLASVQVRRLNLIHSIRKYLASFWRKDVVPAACEAATEDAPSQTPAEE